MREIIPPDAALLRLLKKQELKEDAQYKRSQFTLVVEEQGKTYLLNTFTKQCLECEALPEGLYSTREIARDDALRKWMESYYLVPEDRDEAAFYASSFRLMHTLSQRKAPQIYTILPTLGCNARCVYCFEEGMKPLHMSDEIADAAIRFITQNSRSEQELALSWFGGEPLLKPGIIDRICSGLASHGLRFRSSMVSNGSLITDELLNRMQGLWNLKAIQISMDGDEQSYIRRKQYPRYSDEYHRVIASVAKLAERGMPVNVRCNVDADNVADAAALIRDLEAAVAKKESVSVSFAVLYQARESEADLAVWQRSLELWDTALDAGFKVSPFLGPHLRFRGNHCMADGGGIVIAPDGRLYSCEHCPEESCFGSVQNGVTRPEARLSFARHEDVREECRHCPFLPECTAFQNCPVRDRHCRQVRELLYAAALRQRIKRQDTALPDNTDESIC